MHTTDSATDFKKVMSRFPTGVTVVTAIQDGLPVGFTCQSFVSLSLEPPLISLALAKNSTSWPLVRAAGAFCVNVLEESQQEVGLQFARSGSEKFAGVDWSPGVLNAPRIAGSVAWIECTLEAVQAVGDHEIAIGRVVSLANGEGRPILFHESRFTTLAAREVA